MRKFIEDAMASGFTREQAEFLWSEMARKGHHHTIEEVDELEDILDDISEEVED